MRSHGLGHTLHLPAILPWLLQQRGALVRQARSPLIPSAAHLVRLAAGQGLASQLLISLVQGQLGAAAAQSSTRHQLSNSVGARGGRACCHIAAEPMFRFCQSAQGTVLEGSPVPVVGGLLRQLVLVLQPLLGGGDLRAAGREEACQLCAHLVNAHVTQCMPVLYLHLPFLQTVRTMLPCMTPAICWAGSSKRRTSAAAWRRRIRSFCMSATAWSRIFSGSSAALTAGSKSTLGSKG